MNRAGDMPVRTRPGVAAPAHVARTVPYCEGAEADWFDLLKSSSAFFMQSRWAASPDMFLQVCFASDSDPPFLRAGPAAVSSGGVVGDSGDSRKVGCVGGVAGDGAG